MNLFGKKIAVFLFALSFLSVTFCEVAGAQEETSLDYGEDVILDSDLDGLTDLGEENIFGTDPLDPDSDGDGLFDGAEVMGKSDPLDSGHPFATKVIKEVHSLDQREVPWAWYIARGTGIIAFVLLYFSILFGLIIRLPRLSKFLKPLTSLDFHKWFSVHALLLALVHGVALMFDEFIAFSAADVFVPFYAEYETKMVAFGVIGFYLMLILIVTSYAKKFMKHAVWRVVHSFNIILYVLVSIHMMYLGTDAQEEYFRIAFLVVNVVLIFALILHIGARIHTAKERRKRKKEVDTSE